MRVGGTEHFAAEMLTLAPTVITPEVERSLYTLREQYKRMMHDTFGVPGYLTRPGTAPDLPPGPPPPPPPDTIAFPDEDRRP